MTNFNNVVIVGRVDRDPELRHSPSGSPACSFSVATSLRVTNEAGEKVEQVTVIDVDTRKRLAEICAQFLKKGREVLLMGALRQSQWVDPTTEEPRSKIKVLAQVVQFLGTSHNQEALPVEEEK